MLRWQLLLATGCFLLISVSESASLIQIKKGVKRTKKAPPVLRDWDHSNRAVCSGTYNGRTLAGDDRIDDLRNMYENCTRVRGNLEITHLTLQTLGPNVTLKDRLRMFDHIEEIKGYLLIYNVDIELLKFPKLRIIWGDELFEDHTDSTGAALMISGNHNLKEISMPKLRTIHSGDVLVENNTFLCFLRDKINWNELLNMASESRLLKRHNAFRQCTDEREQSYKCHSNCTSGHCWGPSISQCQEMYRTPCKDCSSGQCYFSEEDGDYRCCHLTCEGGCTGPKDTECIACKEYKLDNACVSKCPPLKILDKKTGRKVHNPDGYYTDDRYCVKQCPSQMLIEDETCVRHCSIGYFHDIYKDTRMCERCPNDNCTVKACEVSSPLTGPILRNLSGCEIINGFINIQTPRMEHATEGYKVSDLYVLRSVRVVSEYVKVVGGTISPTNLSFLENLEIIEGRDLDTKRYGMVIGENDNLKELGLRKLKKIKAGNVFIRKNHRLCFANTVNWTEYIIASNAETSIASNMNEDACVRRKKVCHEQCDPNAGCWGEGPRMCVLCNAWKRNDNCVSECPTEGFYQNEETKECLPCYGQCNECRGPGEEDCINCRNVALYQSEEQLTCLEECPVTHFQKNEQCIPCHESCYEFGCTGPHKTLGEGGCNKCRFALLNGIGMVEHCLFTDRWQSEICVANNLSHHYVSTTHVHNVELVSCAECDDQCLSCTSAGRGVELNGCQCKNYINQGTRGKQTCSPGCFDFSYEVEPKTEKEPGVCVRCADVCDHNSGCNGPSASDCHKCANASLTLDGGSKICVSVCPLEKPFVANVDDEKICASKDLDAIKRKRQTIIYASVVTFIFAFFVVFIIVIWRCRRMGKKLEKERIENLADIPEMMEMTTAVRPNLNKVNLIAASELQNKSIKLGSGAFGVVYAGYWYPKVGGAKKVPVAIKVVRASGKIRGEEEGRMLEEAGRMAQLRHQHLLRLVGVCLRDDGLELVTLLRPLGNLLGFVRKHRDNLLGKDLLLYCYQIASAMKYLYEHKLVHRDLAARNVLVRKTDHVEVTDFGLSKFISYGEQEVKVTEGKVALKWIAPECYSTHLYTHQTDVWSYGVTCWEILTFGESPYKGMQPFEIKKMIFDDGLRLAQPDNCSTALYQILLHCWMMNPDSRPSFVTLYERFKEFYKTPSVFVTTDASTADWNQIEVDQTKQLRELMDDEECWDNVEDPLNYFETGAFDSDSITGQPVTRNLRRLTSTSSHRYQTDPMSRPNLLSNRSVSIGIEDNNYLIPDSKLNEHQAVLYTPVVVNENGCTELVETNEYYNDPEKPSTSADNEYYNDFGKNGSLKRIQEVSEEVEKESCL